MNSALDLPDMEYCIARGWASRPAPPVEGYTKNGTPRKFRKVALSKAEYSRERRQRLIADGMTARGTPRLRTYRRHTT